MEKTSDFICTLHFLGETDVKKTIYPHRSRIVNTDEGIRKLFDKIKRSDYMPALCEDAAGNKCSRAIVYNQSAHFISADVIVIDCDGKITIDEFKKLAEPYNYFLITTRSHGIKPGDHFRVGFPLGIVITDVTLYLKYLNKIIEFCKGDKSCTDAVRMFFASGSKAVYDYHHGKLIMEFLTGDVREELLNRAPIESDVCGDPKTLDYWYGLTVEEVKNRFKTVDDGERNAHLFGATGHFIFAFEKGDEETLLLIEECNQLLPNPKPWRIERPKIITAIQTWKKRTESIKEEKKKPENKYNLDDIDLARFFADEIRNEFRWCEEHDIWYQFGGGVWEKDYGLRINESCKKAMKKRIEIGKLKLKTMPKELRKKYVESLKKLLNHNKRNSIIKDTRSILSIFADEFDSKDMLLNFENGTLDFESDIFYKHSFDEYHTKKVSCNYISGEKTPGKFIDFINEIFENNSDLIGYMQKIMGIALTGNADRQEFYILHGDGGNGKSVLISVFSKLLDKYVYSTDAEKIMSSPHANNKDTYLAQFKNKRAIFCFEAGQGKRLDIPLVKLLTGGEPLNVAQKYEVAQEFTIKAKPFLITNPKPKIDDSTDDAIWRRLRMIPFNFKVMEDKRILGLDAILLESGRSGIINWFINGYGKYKKEGLKMPDCVLVKTQEYRDESDEIKTFIEERCEIGDGFEIQSSVLFSVYQKWSARPKYYQYTQTSFSLYLKNKKYEKRQGKNNCMYFIGLRLKPVVEPDRYED
jgi:P4 family phage/plasmid primase-like protien